MKKVLSFFIAFTIISALLPEGILNAVAEGATEKTVMAKYEFEDSDFLEGSIVSDSSGNCYDALVAAGNLSATDGVYGKGINFNGNGYIELPWELVDNVKNSSAVTISAFVKKLGLQHQFLFSASGKHLSSNRTSIGIIDAYNYRYEGGTSDNITTGQRTVTDEEFVSLTAVLDFEGGKGVLYIDGERVSEGNITSDFNHVGTLVAGIGVSPWNDPYYKGHVDEFTIYNGALTDEEVHRVAGKMSLTPVYKDSESGREYRGETVKSFPGLEVSFAKIAKDDVNFYNYTATGDSLTAVVEYNAEGSYDYIIDSTSEKNAALKIADYLTIGGDCSEDEITLPDKVTEYEESSVTWISSSEYAEVYGNNVIFTKSEITRKIVLTGTITYEGESCLKDFDVLVHANDCLPTDADIATDINKMGYVATDSKNLIDKEMFDYTCNTYTGWTTGGEALNDNFSISEGYNDCGAVFAESIGLSTAIGSINPYIPLPEHTGEETFIITFAAYAPSYASIEWSKIVLCDENGNVTTTVSGSFDGANYKYGVKCSPDWTINRVAFTPAESDKYIRILIGWAENIGIDNISIVRAEKKMITVSERYVDNSTAYDEEPVVLEWGEESYSLQYGESYTSRQIPSSIIYEGEEYVPISDNNPREIDVKEDSLVIDYKYAKADELFVHPGVLNTQADLERIAQKVKNGEEPYLSAYNAMLENGYAQIGMPRATEVVSRGGSGDNCALFYQDVARAYFCAIRWKIEGDTAYGDCARDILNAWSHTLKTVTGNADRYLASGLYGYEIAAAAEIMRDYPGFERDRMQKMLLEVFYKPLIERFLYSNEYGSDHNGANITNYWANWDLCNMAAATAIGVFCDRRDIYNRALEYYKFGPGNGSVFNTVPKLYEAEESVYNIPIGQWQEAGRDMPHTELGIGIMATMCEIAWNQGDDLYGWANNRFMYGAEYIAQYQLGNDVPFTTYNWRSGQGGGSWSEHSVIAGRGNTRNVWEMVYNHYVNRMGYDLPAVTAIAEKTRPEGGPGGHASSFDYFGFGTLLYTREYDESLTKAKLPESNIKEGIYRITSRGTGSALTDVNGSVLQYAPDETNKSQLWELADLGGGIYTVTNVNSGMTMCVENGSYANGALIKTDNYSGRFSQQFAFLTFEENYYEGYYRIVPVHSGLSLDVLNSLKDDGTEILQYTYGTAYNQQWELTLVEEKNTEAPEATNTEIEVSLKNDEEESRNFIVFNGVYNDGILMRVKSANVTVPAKSEMVQTFRLWVSSDEYVKTYVWDKNLSPIKGLD